MNQKASNETQEQALAVAKSIKKAGQTKEQTKLIAKGIEKGISEYKKQQKVKSRQRDKFKKQQAKSKTQENTTLELEVAPSFDLTSTLPWILLALSWFGFIFYHFI
jgi:hypothetical protein